MRVEKTSWFDRVLNVLGGISAISLIVMMTVTVVDVIMTNVFHRPIIGAFDLVVTALVFAVFLGIPLTFHREANIVVDVADHLLRKETVAVLRQAARVLSLLFLVILLYNMVEPALDAYKYGEKKQELGLPLYVIWIPILLGVALAIWSVVDLLMRKRRHAVSEGT
jgi:TRAP-type C4-dicarboxylate transport system permease small subunit